jgi:diguanylate cyclase
LERPRIQNIFKGTCAHWARAILIVVDPQTFKLLSSMSDLVVRFDANGTILQASGETQSFLDLPASPVGKSIHLYIHPDDAPAFQEAREMSNLLGKKLSFVCRLLKRNGQPAWMDCHIVRLPSDEYLMSAFDAAHWKENEDRLASQSAHDALTGLPGRALIDDLIRMSINNAMRENNGLALLVLDLDGFKKVNDSLGHRLGDSLIKAVAERITGVMRRSDSLARLGGDEFALIMVTTGEDRGKSIETVARKLLAAIQRPYQIHGQDIYITASVGGAIHIEHGSDATTLLKHAEIAMYSAKAQGRNRWELYDSQIDRHSSDLSLETAMHEGIQKGEFLLHYQPIFCMQTGVLRGAETLMRWERAGHGMISPAKFIPIAEASGLIEILGTWALRIACHQTRQWQQAGLEDFYVSVNVSPGQFRKAGFINLVKNTLAESGLPPSSLMLEITEGVLMSEPEKSRAQLAELRGLGVKIAIDDFGTGYSSLSYLKKFPLSVLKIDKSFVDDIPKCAEDVAIVSAVLSLASGLKLTVVAEGVESSEQLDLLKQKGCDLVQGFLTGRPVNVAIFQEKYLQQV